MSVLDSIADIAYNSLKDIFSTFTVVRKIAEANDKPWQSSVVSSEEYSCKAMKSGYKSFEIDGTRIQTGDCKIIILAKSLPSGIKTSDIIKDPSGKSWKIVSVNIDPANATFKCQCR